MADREKLDEISMAIEFVNGALKIGKALIDLADRSALFEVKVDTAVAAGTYNARIILKPSERLMDLVAATRTLKIQGAV